MIEQDIQVSKGGETQIQALVSRCRGGIKIDLKVHPQVEEALRLMGSGEQLRSADYGRTWRSATFAESTLPDGKSRKIYDPLPVWSMAGYQGWLSGLYRLDQVGMPLIPERDPRIPLDPSVDFHQAVNLSFLRLCGASEGRGVSFVVEGMYSPEMIMNVAQRIRNAGRQFYIDFLRPVEVFVTVMTQQMKG